VAFKARALIERGWALVSLERKDMSFSAYKIKNFKFFDTTKFEVFFSPKFPKFIEKSY
jgi:hypothetical protein